MKILIKAVAGSHLFGTNTPSSDMDYKGVFLPEAEDILLGKFDQTIHQHTNNTGSKNTKDDVDIEFYSLDKFLKMLYQGQTVAWELLFTPDHMIIEKHPLWDDIRYQAPRLVNKKVDAFIGYCKQQAHKYGVRGSRMEAVSKSIEILMCHQCYGAILTEEIMDEIIESKIEHVEKYLDIHNKQMINICGKKFGIGTPILYVLHPLEKYYAEYGERSKLARQNQGIDWKALSHAVRVCMQAISLLSTGKIELPMKEGNVTLLKDIKAGKLSFDEVANLIEQYQDDMMRAKEESTLPEEPNLKAFQQIQIDIYEKIVSMNRTQKLIDKHGSHNLL